MGATERRFDLGTAGDVTRILPANPRRAGYKIIMPSTSKIAANTGRVHVAKNGSPSTTLGDPNQGDIMLADETISAWEGFPGDPTLHRGEIRAAGSANNQIIMVQEWLWDDESVAHFRFLKRLLEG